MISLETAKKLKEAGLKWEPEHGDWFHHNAFGHEIVSNKFPPEKVTEGFIWLPRLDQLLSEVEKRGWYWSIYKDRMLDNYACFINQLAGGNGKQCIEKSPEEATAEALIWILEQED